MMYIRIENCFFLSFYEFVFEDLILEILLFVNWWFDCEFGDVIFWLVRRLCIWIFN